MLITLVDELILLCIFVHFCAHFVYKCLLQIVIFYGLLIKVTKNINTSKVFLMKCKEEPCYANLFVVVSKLSKSLKALQLTLIQ